MSETEHGTVNDTRDTLTPPSPSKWNKAVRSACRVAPWNFLKSVGRKVMFGGIERACHLSSAEVARQRTTVFPKAVTFSILVPLFNTPLSFLEDMIASVQAQTYPHWELCLADGSDDTHSDVGARCRELARSDARIVYQKLSENGGISENTNACIAMATGDFICLFDHDDLLHPSALFETMTAICRHNADLVYTDEATFTKHGPLTVLAYHHKPDFAPDNLRANNYICHFTSFSRTLLDEVGGFRSDFDGSQDHDMILRLSEKAKHIHHVPKVLYFWRSHGASVASDLNSKPYVLDAGMRAVRDSIERTTGQACTVERATASSAHYRVRYSLPEKPLVSIVMHSITNEEALFRCVASVTQKTSYDRYELLIPPSSTLSDTMRERLTAIDRVRTVDGVCDAGGDYLVLLSAQTEVITPDWVEELLMYAVRTDVGAVGAKLLYPDRTVAHAGILIGIGKDRLCASAHHGLDAAEQGYAGRLCYAQNVSAVSAACMMTKTALFKELDPTLGTILGGVDRCLQLQREGFLNVFTPFAALYHHVDKKERPTAEEARHFRTLWHDTLEKGDPYFNPNLSPAHTDFRLK